MYQIEYGTIEMMLINDAIHKPEENAEQPKSSPAHSTSAVKRFFHRSGMPLG